IADQAVDALLKFVISGNLHPAWHDNLDEHHASAQLRMGFQSFPERAHPLGNSFAEIEPVHTQDQLAITKISAQVLGSAGGRAGACTPFKSTAKDAPSKR